MSEILVCSLLGIEKLCGMAQKKRKVSEVCQLLKAENIKWNYEEQDKVFFPLCEKK